MRQYPQAIAILGPTSSGKSDVAIWVAKKFGGEVISCDSRQIYRGMDIGTGKVANDFTEINNFQFPISKKNTSHFFSEGIRHHMIDIVSPNTDYNVSKFQKKTKTLIKDILKRKKLPILCGGTGLWAQALVENYDIPQIPPDTKLRRTLSQLSLEELQQKLRKLDPKKYNTIDKQNPRRLVRALEISQNSKLEKRNFSKHKKDAPAQENIQWEIIVINPPREKLYKNIEKRLNQRFRKRND